MTDDAKEIEVQPGDTLRFIGQGTKQPDGTYGSTEIVKIFADGRITYRQRPITEMTREELLVAIEDIVRLWARLSPYSDK